MKDVMLRTFIQAGCAQPSRGVWGAIERERLKEQTSPAQQRMAKKIGNKRHLCQVARIFELLDGELRFIQTMGRMDLGQEAGCRQFGTSSKKLTGKSQTFQKPLSASCTQQALNQALFSGPFCCHATDCEKLCPSVTCGRRRGRL